MCAQDALEWLSEITTRRTAFIGLGNRDRGDDAVGLRFIDELKHLNPGYFFSEEEGLESIILRIIKDEGVDNVIFVDSCDFGSKPGEVSFFKSDDIGESISAHKVPLSMLMALIQKEGKNSHLVAIQPKSLDLMANLSNEVERSLDILEKQLNDLLG